MKLKKYLLPLALGISLACFQTASGLIVVIAFSTKIIIDAGFHSQPEIISVVTGAVLLSFSLIPTLLVDKFGRRFFMLFSTSTAFVSLFLIGLYFYLTEVKHITGLSVLSVTSIITYFMAFSLGLGPVVFVLLGEILPMKARSLGVSVAIVVAYAIGFGLTKEFLSMLQTLTTYGTFWMFAAVNLLGTLFVAFLVPETKGKSLEEIEALFQGAT